MSQRYSLIFKTKERYAKKTILDFKFQI